MECGRMDFLHYIDGCECVLWSKTVEKVYLNMMLKFGVMEIL